MFDCVCLLLLASVVSGSYVAPQFVGVQKVGYAPSARNVFVSGHMGPAHIVSLPNYDYSAHQVPVAVYHGPVVSDQPMVEHAPLTSQMKRDPRMAAPVQYFPSMIHHGAVHHPQPAVYLVPHYPRQHLIQYNHGTQPSFSVEAHEDGYYDQDSHVDIKSVEYELLEDIVSSDKKSTMTHKTSYLASSNPMEYDGSEDSAYASASWSSHNEEEEDDYVPEEVHDAPAMIEPDSVNPSPVIASVPASHSSQMVVDHNVQPASPIHLDEIV